MKTIERVNGEYLNVVPVDDPKVHADDGWCWCAPESRIATVAERLRTGAVRVVEHEMYVRRIGSVV